MRCLLPALLAVTLLSPALPSPAAELVRGRPSLVLSNASARLVVDLGGGSISDFRRRGSGVNPLHWATPAPGDATVRGFGHFLCLDRWGPPSGAEGALGMPYHGEAANVPWTSTGDDPHSGDSLDREMTATLPRAGFSVRRRIRLSPTEPVFVVEEEVTNRNPLGRLYNAVQHPTIGPPFLDAQTIVDCNGRRGFAQGGSLPHPEKPAARWPKAPRKDGGTADLRHLSNDPEPNVVTYALGDSLGWVTATSPSTGLLLGYLWRTADYPWVSHWRDVRDGKPAARGLEFGTTGLHQPFPVLVKRGRIWNRPVFAYLDAGESVRRSYVGFLMEIPPDFAGVDRVSIADRRLLVRERARGRGRVLSLPLGDLPTP